LLATRQKIVGTVIAATWVLFAIGLSLVIVRADSRGRDWERALARSEARMRSILAAFPDPVLVVDRNGMILDVPSPSQELLPDAPDRLKGSEISVLVGKGKGREAKELIGRAIAGSGEVLTLEYEQEVQGVKKMFEGRILAIRGAATPRVLWMAHDLTGLKHAQERRLALERRIQQAQKLESLGAMAGGIAHDFDNLLTAVIGHAEFAMGMVDADSPVRDSLGDIHTTACRAAELAAQMLKYSGNTRLESEMVDLCELALTVEQELAPELPDGVELNIFRAAPEAEFEGDQEQVRQVLRNLVFNAVEAIAGEEGKIDVHVGVRECSVGELSDNYLKENHPPGKYAFLRVEDSGCGIGEDDYDRLFDPFFTTKFTGRGLGLAAVQGIVRSHEGVIRVRTQPGSGTSFEILFPLRKRERSDVDGRFDYGSIL
jgi:PAS domain S-box-containing protein